MYQTTIRQLSQLPILFVWTLLFISSCTNKEQRLLQDSLEKAKENRTALKQVLQHYAEIDKNEEKLAAAKFLIINMQEHLSFDDDILKAYADSLALCSTTTPKDNIYRIWEHIKTEHPHPQITSDKDLETLSATYLIDNIDKSYKAWKEAPWNKQISFDIYCKYILPYRIHNEKLSKIGWRDTLSSRYKTLIEDETDIKKAFATINQQITHYFRNTQPNYPRQMDALSLDKIRPGNCSLRCNLTIYVLRALGIPASYDFVPFWSNYSTVGHSWVALVTHPDSTFSLHKGDSLPKYHNIIDGSIFKTDFLPEKDYPIRLDSVKKATQVLRYEYEIQQTAPSVSFIKEVSPFYLIDHTLEIKKAPVETGFCLLSVFETGKDWMDIKEAPVNNHHVSFTHIGDNQLYLLTYMDEKRQLCQSVPILFHKSGELEYLEAHPHQKSTVVVYRKYPLFIHQVETWCKMKGCIIEGSMSPDFRQADTLFTVEKTPCLFAFHRITPQKAYRYVRYKNTNRWATALAEFEIYGKTKLHGTPIGSHPDTSVLAKGVDGQYDTFVTSQGPDYWFGLDLGNPAPLIEQIRFLPKNDANFVEPGHLYELLYYDNKWISLGMQKATCDSLVYQVPEHCLMILRDKTAGKEERPFTYRNKQQIWW